MIRIERDLDCQIATMRRLWAMLRGAAERAETDTRLPRLILALRAFDARTEGASLREIATALLDEFSWPGDGDWMKSWSRRIVELAAQLVQVGPRGVLRREI